MANEAPTEGLRRRLKLWQVVGLSIGLMAPSMAISINPQGAISAVGRAIPLSFAIAMAGALLVAWGFARLSQHFHSPGSALGLVGATLGARPGVVAGWCLAGTYVLFALLTGITAGIYGTLFLQAVSVIHTSPGWLAYTIGGLTVAGAGLLAVVPTTRATQVIVSFEGVTITFIVVAGAVVLAKLLGHSGPGHLGFTWSVFTPARGTGGSGLFLGVVFGLLSFGGFEGAATMGGEATRPRRVIPRALLLTVGAMGVFYVAASAIEVMGFGTTAAGLERFSQSPALFGTLGQTYVAQWFGDVIIAGTVMSAFGCSMASVVGASRIVMTFARDGLGPRHPLARLSPGTATPVVAVVGLVVFEAILMTVFGAAGTPPLTLFVWTGTISTLLLMVAYGLVTAGAGSFLFVQPLSAGRRPRARTIEAVLPLAGLGLLGYTVYRNVVPYPTGSAAWLPVVAGAWVGVALVFVGVAPAASRRLGERILTDEGTRPSAENPAALQSCGAPRREGVFAGPETLRGSIDG